MISFLNIIYTFYLKLFLYNLGSKSIIESFIKYNNLKSVSIGKSSYICSNVWFNSKPSNGKVTLKIGNGVYIGRDSQINCWSSVQIEDNVLIADRVYISDAEHHFKNKKIPIISQGDYFKNPVLLKSGSWIGIGAVILPGVTIGKNAVVGPYSVVRENVPDYSIYLNDNIKKIKKIRYD